MKVILLETKEVKEVADGYARHYLFPRRLAILATEKNLRQLEKGVKEAEEKRKRADKKAVARKRQLESKPYEIEVKVGKGKKIHGSVTAAKIAKEVGLEKEDVLLDEPIKELGEYEIEIKADSQKAKIKLKVRGKSKSSAN
jgi:large subunit ribosomal protein L9